MTIELTQAQERLLDGAVTRLAFGRSVWNAEEAFAAEHLGILGLVTISANPNWIAPRVFATDEGRSWMREHFLGDIPMERQSMSTKQAILEEVEDVMRDLKKDEEDDVDVSRRAFCLMRSLRKHFDDMPADRLAMLRDEFDGDQS